MLDGAERPAAGPVRPVPTVMAAIKPAAVSMADRATPSTDAASARQVSTATRATKVEPQEHERPQRGCGYVSMETNRDVLWISVSSRLLRSGLRSGVSL